MEKRVITKLRNVGIVQHCYHQSGKFVDAGIQNHVLVLIFQRLNNPIRRMSEMIGQQYLFPFKPNDFENTA